MHTAMGLLETGWWLRLITGAVMLGVAVITRNRPDLSFYCGVLSFVGLVTLPTEETVLGVVDHTSKEAVGSMTVMLAMVFLIPFLIGLAAGPGAAEGANRNQAQPQSLATQQHDGYILTTVAVFAALMIDAVPHGVTNVLMGLSVLPAVVAAAHLGGLTQARARDKRKVINGRATAERTLMTVYALMLIMLLITLRRVAIPIDMATPKTARPWIEGVLPRDDRNEVSVLSSAVESTGAESVPGV